MNLTGDPEWHLPYNNSCHQRRKQSWPPKGNQLALISVSASSSISTFSSHWSTSLYLCLSSDPGARHMHQHLLTKVAVTWVHMGSFLPASLAWGQVRGDFLLEWPCCVIEADKSVTFSQVEMKQDNLWEGEETAQVQDKWQGDGGDCCWRSLWEEVPSQRCRTVSGAKEYLDTKRRTDFSEILYFSSVQHLYCFLSSQKLICFWR